MKPNLAVVEQQPALSPELSHIPTWKRAVDIACILIATPVIFPLMALITVGIKVVSSGPVFFKQQRIGYLGKPFLFWKFRTMRVGADVGSHKDHLGKLIKADLPMTKMDVLGDPRLIPLGAVLRATGLDELPQIINVLLGDMSLVGPRPCLPYEYEMYQPWHKQRFDTLPGLTGLWQVSGKNKTTFNEMVRLDILYARNKSVWLDLKIMGKTISTLLTQVREASGRRSRPVAAGGSVTIDRSTKLEASNFR